MVEGFREQQVYTDNVHLEALNLLRYVGYTNYIAIPTKKSFKKKSLEQYYPLRSDKEKEKKVYSNQFREDFFNQKQPYITNGKLRGYIDRYGNLETIN